MKCWISGPSKSGRSMPRAVSSAAALRERARYDIDQALGAVVVTEGEHEHVIVWELDEYEETARAMLRLAAQERARQARLQTLAKEPRPNTPEDLGYLGSNS